MKNRWETTCWVKCCVPSCDWLCYLFGPQEAVVHHNVFKTSSLLIEYYVLCVFYVKEDPPRKEHNTFRPIYKTSRRPNVRKNEWKFDGYFLFLSKTRKKTFPSRPPPSYEWSKFSTFLWSLLHLSVFRLVSPSHWVIHMQSTRTKTTKNTRASVVTMVTWLDGGVGDGTEEERMYKTALFLQRTL